MRWYADWIHSLRERHWLSELNQGDVTAESWRIVLWMWNDFYSSHLFFCSLICVTIVIANDNFIVRRISGKWKEGWMVWQMVLIDVFKLFWIHVIIYFNTTSQILLNPPPYPPPVAIKWPSWSFKTRIFCAYFLSTISCKHLRAPWDTVGSRYYPLIWNQRSSTNKSSISFQCYLLRKKSIFSYTKRAKLKILHFICLNKIINRRETYLLIWHVSFLQHCGWREMIWNH